MKITNHLFAFVFGLNSIIAVSQSGIDFSYKSLEEAKEIAARENKIIFVDAYADWCGPCKWMSANTFPDSEVGNYYNEQFISLQIDMESEIGMEFDLEYGVDSYPTLLFLNSKGKVIKRHSGALDALEFLSLGKRIIDPTSALSYQLKLKSETEGMTEELVTDYLIACMEESEEADENIKVAYQSILEKKCEKDSQLIADYLIQSKDFELDVNDKLVTQYFSELNIDTLIDDEPFTIFYYYQQDLKGESTLYFIKNYAEFEAVWGENVEDKLGLLIVNSVEEIMAGTLKKEELYSFIKLYSEFNDVDYNELKLLVDEFLNS